MKARFSFLLMLLIILAPGSRAEELVAKLPAFARSISYDAETRTVGAALALQGVAFFTLPEEADGEATDLVHHPEWPTLDVLPVGDDRFLLAGRFGNLRLLERGEGGAFSEVAIWPCEGIPTDLLRHNNLLLVGCGPAGLRIYEWKGGTDEPILRGRYPFVDYTKELALSGKGIIHLADNFDTGLQTLDIRELKRPRMLSTVRMDFVDSVSREGNLVAVAARRVGTGLFDVSDPSQPRQAGFIKGAFKAPRPGPDVKRVALHKSGRLVVCEGTAGARLFQLAPKGSRIEANKIAEFHPGDGSISEATFLPDGRLLLVSNDGAVYLH